MNHSLYRTNAYLAERAKATKPRLWFYFADEPQFATQDSRESTANRLRAYRAHPERYKLTFCCRGLYFVENRYPGSTAVGVIAATLPL
jgi:hypothetical protein